MSLMFAALALMAQDGLSYDGPPLDQLSADSYAIYFDRTMTGPFIALEGEGPDGMLTSIKTEKCVTQIVGRQQNEDGKFDGPEQTWVIDWKTVSWVGQDVPYFFAVRDKDDKLLAFLTGREEDSQATREADMLSITSAYGAAQFLHMACNPAAKARYEELAKPPEAVK